MPDPVNASGRPGRRTLLGVRVNSPHLRGGVSNVSDSGVLIETHSNLKIGRVVEMTLHHRSASLDVLAEVRWSRLIRTETKPGGDTLPVYRTGLRFVEILSESPEGVWIGAKAHEAEQETMAARRPSSKLLGWLGRGLRGGR